VTNQPLVYIDTNVFGYVLLPNQKQYLGKKAESFFQDIVNGKYLGITSTLTQIEYLSVAKRLLSQYKGNQITSHEEQAVMNDLDQFIDTLGIGLINADESSSDPSGMVNIFSSTRQIILIANAIFNVSKKQWQMIGSIDSLMTNLAIRAGAQLFATFDKGFKGLNNPSITALLIDKEY
jgi:hypothetical protein